MDSINHTPSHSDANMRCDVRGWAMGIVTENDSNFLRKSEKKEDGRHESGVD